NAIQLRRIFGDDVDQILAKVSSATVTYFQTDRQGTVRDLTTGTGVALEHLNYDAFGKILADSNPSVRDAVNYTGGYLDAATGKIYRRARYYNPETGRWEVRDLIGFDGGTPNLYEYVGNNASNDTDPSGLLPPGALLPDEIKRPTIPGGMAPGMVVTRPNDPF